MKFSMNITPLQTTMSVFLKILRPYQHGNHTEFMVEATLLSHTTGYLNFPPVKI